MRILIENGAHDLTNMGDVAMLRVALERLRRIFPSAELYVLTSDPQRLQQLAPGALPCDVTERMAWCNERLLPLWPKRLAQFSPSRMGRLRSRWPFLWESCHNLTMTLLRSHSREARRFLDLMESIDLVFATGAGFLTDAFSGHAIGILLTFEKAMSMNKPVVMFGQGLGPVADPHLTHSMRQVLPRVALLALREKRCSLPLALSLGVAPEKLFVTGDEAIEPAFEGRQVQLGSLIGLNIRVAHYSGIDRQNAIKIGTVIKQCSDVLATQCHAIPIQLALYNELSDLEAMQPILSLYPDQFTDTPPVKDPADVIQLVRRCRVMVTGSYHAGVFALSQGIPVVGLSACSYYATKFLGLRDQFGTGCNVVCLDNPSWQEDLYTAINTAYEHATPLRAGLLARAREQIRSSQAVYKMLAARVLEGGSPCMN